MLRIDACRKCFHAFFSANLCMFVHACLCIHFMCFVGKRFGIFISQKNMFRSQLSPRIRKHCQIAFFPNLPYILQLPNISTNKIFAFSKVTSHVESVLPRHVFHTSEHFGIFHSFQTVYSPKISHILNDLKLRFGPKIHPTLKPRRISKFLRVQMWTKPKLSKGSRPHRIPWTSLVRRLL